MKHYLLNHQPQKGLQAACAQQGQAPTCNARGKGHTSASPKTLTRILLVLLTMFLLPSAAWGETKTYTYNFSQTSIQQSDVDEINNTVNGWKYVEPYNYTPIVDWDAVYFTKGLTSFTSPINFPASITSVTIKADARYATEVTINGTKKNLSANSALRFDASSNYYAGMSPQTLEFTSITLDSPGPLKIEFSDTDEGLLAIESITIVYEPETYPITIAGIAVTNENASNITGTGITGKVSFTPAGDTTPATLTLVNATIIPEGEGRGISYTGTDNLTISLKGSNTVKGVGGCNAILYDGTGVATPTLTFTNGGTEPCSLQLESVNEPTIAGFSSVVNTGLYKIDETILGADQSNTYKTTITNLGGGSGESAEDPILIKTKEDLKNFSKLVNNESINTNVSVQLYNDIDCNGLTGYEAAGDYWHQFNGVFDGNEKTISNLTAQDALFYYVNGGTIKDLTLSGCTITGYTDTDAAGIAINAGSQSNIENCSVVNSTIACKANAYNPKVGGIVANLSDGTVTGCTIDNVQVKAETTYTGGSGPSGYVGGIVGNAFGGEISSCLVKNGSKMTNYYADESATLNSGAIAGNYYDTKLSANNYHYDVIIENLNGTNTDNKVTKSGYTQRGVGGTYYNETTEQNESNPDVTADNGAVMYTKTLTLTGGVSYEGVDFYEPLSDDDVLALAPGQTVDIEVFPADGVTISSASLVYTPTGGTEQTVPLENKSETAGEYNYVFEMPDADATLNATIVQTYDLWIGETQVTSTNAANVLGDGKVSFTESVGVDTAPTYTLTLNGAALTAPVKVGLANLTIDIQGTNTITTNTTCIQNTAATGVPSLTFKSSGDVVGSLTLTDTDEEGTNGVISDSFFEHFTISKELALVMLRYGNYTSDTYYFSAGEVHNAQLLPSYGVQIGDTQIHAGNAADVFEDGTVSFDKTTNTLTLNGANTGALSTWLPELKVELVGSNKLSEAGSYPVLRSLNDAKVTIKIQSTSATKGSLTMSQPYTEEKNFYDGNVTVSIVEPLAVVSGSLEGNDGNANTVVIGESYGLTVAGVTVSNVNASAVTGTYIQKKTDDGFVSYDAESNTLTLNNVNLSTTASAPIIVSSLDALKVNIVGNVEFEFQDVTPSYVFGSTNPNGVLTFTTTDDGKPQIYIDNGSNNGAFTGFKTVNYEKGLALRTQQIDYTDYWIEPMVAPAFGAFSLNAETGKLTGTITSYAYEGATIKYSIDYADDHENVSNAVYSTSVVMEGPGTVTAYIAVGESTSPVTTAKWFAFASHEVQGVKGQESVAVPAVIPTIETSDDITVTYSSENATIASVSEGNIAFNGVGATTISGLYEIGDEVPFIILNDGDIFDEIAVTVVPPAPVIAYDGTKTYLSTDKIEISLDPTYAAAPSGSNTIYYSWDENPTTGTEYPEGGVEAQNGTLTAWVVATVSDVNYPSAKATQEFTVKTDISSYIVSGLAESETYTGSAIVPEFTVKATATATTSLTANTDYTVSYKKVGESEALTDVTSMVDAGSYKIIITGAGNYGGSISKDFEIKKASVDWENTGWTSPEAKADLVFTNEAKDLITGATVPDGVTVKYCYKYSTSEFDEQTRSELPDPANWTTTIPQGTNIGYYAVFYKVEGGNNYEDWGPNEVGIVINIGKGEANITADNQTTTYTGSPIEYEKDNITLSLETISKDGIGISYIGPDPNDPGKTITLDGAPTAAGTYTVEITLADEHYNAETVNATLTIEQLDISQADITLDNTVLTYNGEQQTVNVTKVMAGDIEVPIDCYEVSGNTEKEAGDYKLTVTAKTVDGSGNPIKNNFTGSAEKAWKIINHRTIPAEVIAEKFTSEGQTYATFNDASESFLAPQGIVAYIITGVSGNSVTVKAVSYIKAGIPVLLQKTSTSTETEETTDDIFATNILKYAERDLTSNGGQYVLYKNEFVKATGSITSGKCYLEPMGTFFAGTRGFSIAGGAEGTTAISDAVADSDHSEWFDLQGRKIEKPSKKGLYIRDGKKIVVK